MRYFVKLRMVAARQGNLIAAISESDWLSLAARGLSIYKYVVVARINA